MRSRLGILVVSILVIASCSRLEINNNPDNGDIDMESLNIINSFDWETSKAVGFNLAVKDNSNQPIPNVRLSVYTDDPEEGGKLIFSGFTNSQGIFNRNYELPTYFDSITITNNFIGINNMVRVPVNNGNISFMFGGQQSNPKTSLKNSALKNTQYGYLGDYNSLGVPDYLEAQNDVIDADFLNDVNNSLPEQITLPESHPEYLDPDNSYDIKLLDPCDVWVTFVHEGAGYKNTLGFYTYDTNNPPTNVNDIDEVKIIFPNVSYAGSGGGLVSGNKVKIGTFPANTGIGWVIFQNAWQGGQVRSSNAKFYSNPDFNPESTRALRQHTVLLNDIGRDLILLGFEDLRREGGWCDHDFNDAVFYITANPITAIDFTNLPLIDYDGEDLDSDDVPNHMDDYPEDPDKAFNNYFFTEGTYGTLAFEDMWPGTGDYDFNDMVIDYNFNQITNAQNKVVEIRGEFVLKAFGASFHNGFGIDLGIDPALVDEVTGYKLQEAWADVNAKGLENGQSNAVILVFDDTYHLMSHAGGIGVNTSASYPFVTPDTTRIKITLNQPVDLEQIGVPPYNPFMIVNQDRTHEIHLPDHAPTDKASNDRFNTFRDNSNPATGRYYKTDNNLPWAIKTLEPFHYPYEKVEVLSAYLKFAEWAQSSGTLYPDWYKDEIGYRNTGNIYQAPQ